MLRKSGVALNRPMVFKTINHLHICVVIQIESWPLPSRHVVNCKVNESQMWVGGSEGWAVKEYSTVLLVLGKWMEKIFAVNIYWDVFFFLLAVLNCLTLMILAGCSLWSCVKITWCFFFLFFFSPDCSLFLPVSQCCFLKAALCIHNVLH